MRFVVVVVPLLVAGCDSLFGLDDIRPPNDAPLPPPKLVCGEPQPVLASPYTSQLRESGFYTTGLLLLTFDGSDTRLKQLRRDTTTSPFGTPDAVTVLDPTLTDPTFLVIDGEIVAFASRPPMPRHIEVCRNPSPTSTCTPIVVIDEATGTQITDDHDGPAVAVRDDGVVMVLSRGVDYYVATPTGSDLLTWNAKHLDLGTLEVDDGALALAGEMLIMSVGTSLYTLHWDRAAASYVDPTLLPFAGNSPTVFEDGDTLDLVVTSTARGIMEPILVSCMDRRALP